MAYENTLPMDDEGFLFGEYLDALRRRSRSATLIGVGILAFGVALTLLLPNTYKSTATVLIEQPEVPPGLVPTTVTTFAAQQLNYIQQRVMTRTNLASIIEKFDLFPEEREYLPTLLLVEDVQELMSIELISVDAAATDGRQVTQTIAFTLGFEHQSPQVAQNVANELVSLYLAENVRARTVQTAETSEFMQKEVERMDEEVKAIEAEIAQFKRENEGALPSQLQLSLSLLERTESEIIGIQRQLDAIKGSRIQIEAQLAQVDPMSATILPDGRAVVSPTDQLKAAQTELALLEARYSDNHPDVVRVRRELAALEARLGIAGVDLAATAASLRAAQSELTRAQGSYGADHPEVLRLQREISLLQEQLAQPRSQSADIGKLEPDNPAYIQLSTQLNTLQAEAEALEAQRRVLRKRMEDIDSRMMQGTEVERQLSSMSRRLSTATQQYLAARDKLFTAQLGQSLETQSKGERFTLVEPPDLPLRPASPNRPVLLTLFVILALVAGFGWPLAGSMIDGAISGPTSLERIVGAPPIAEIPVITNAEDTSRSRVSRLLVLLGIPLVALAALMAVHFFYMPLDVLWYVLVRRFGL